MLFENSYWAADWLTDNSLKLIISARPVLQNLQIRKGIKPCFEIKPDDFFAFKIEERPKYGLCMLAFNYRRLGTQKGLLVYADILDNKSYKNNKPENYTIQWINHSLKTINKFGRWVLNPCCKTAGSNGIDFLIKNLTDIKLCPYCGNKISEKNLEEKKTTNRFQRISEIII